MPWPRAKLPCTFYRSFGHCQWSCCLGPPIATRTPYPRSPFRITCSRWLLTLHIKPQTRCSFQCSGWQSNFWDEYQYLRPEGLNFGLWAYEIWNHLETSTWSSRQNVRGLPPLLWLTVTDPCTWWEQGNVIGKIDGHNSQAEEGVPTAGGK